MKENPLEAVHSPGTWTGTGPKGKKTPHYLEEPPPVWWRGSTQPQWDTAAPYQFVCPRRTEVPATAGWERTAAVPPAVYHCIATANEQAAAPHCHTDLEVNISGSWNDISQQSIFSSVGEMPSFQNICDGLVDVQLTSEDCEDRNLWCSFFNSENLHLYTLSLIHLLRAFNEFFTHPYLSVG